MAFRPASAAQCEQLRVLELTDTTITLATDEAAGRFNLADPSPFVPDLGELPEFCRVTGVIRPVRGSEIGIEVWLPHHWNRRLLQVGNGGFAGAINYGGLAAAIKQGFAGASTDDGHRTPASVTPTADWSIGHPERIVDFGHRAVHVTSIAAKAIAERYYSEKPTRTYFAGCSDRATFG